MTIFIIVSNPSFGAAYDIGSEYLVWAISTATEVATNRLLVALSTMEWWSLIEASLSAIAACLPNIVFLARKVKTQSSIVLPELLCSCSS